LGVLGDAAGSVSSDPLRVRRFGTGWKVSAGVMKSEKSVKNEGAPDQAQRVVEPVAAARGRSLLVIAFIVIVAAMFVPTGDAMFSVLNVGWIFAGCLLAAVAVIVAAAHEVGQLKGFAGLVFLSVVVREAVAVASVKMLFYKESMCILLEHVGEAAGAAGPGATWAGVMLLMAGTVAAAGWGSKRIMRKASNVTVNSIPYKFISTDADMNAGLISEQRAGAIKQKIVDEAKFYLSAAALSKLLLFDAGISVVVVMAAVGAAMGMAVSAGNVSQAGTVVNSVAAIGLVTLGGAAVTVLLCVGLVSKKAFELANIPETNEAVGFDMREDQAELSTAEAELLNPDFAQVAGARHGGLNLLAGASLDDLLDDNELTASPDGTWNGGDEDDADFESLDAVIAGADIDDLEAMLSESDDELVNADAAIGETGEVSMTDDSITDDRVMADDADDEAIDITAEEDTETVEAGADFYESLVNGLLASAGSKTAVLLLGAENVQRMPVTVAVNAAFRLAGENKKCLVIDADLERRAVAEAFDVTAGKNGRMAEPAQSCIDNLWVWTVGQAEDAGVKIAETIAAAEGKFASVVIYAPQIRDDAYYGKLAGMVHAAVLGEAGEDGYLGSLKMLLEATDCTCFEMVK